MRASKRSRADWADGTTTEIMRPTGRARRRASISSCFVLSAPDARRVSSFTQQITVRGRGARSNASGRFESQTREAFDDGWTLEDPQPAQLRTTLTAEKARTIIAKNDSPDVGFSRSINPYRGCEHGWLYHLVTPT